MDTIETKTTDSHAVTKFVEIEEAKEMKEEFMEPSIPKSDFASIEDFLKRPVHLYTTAWLTTHVAGESLLDLPDVGLPSDDFLLANPMYAEKLAGYNLIRCNVEYRIQINANNFQQGQLIASFLPFQAAMGADYRKMRMFNLATITQLPCIELNCRNSVVGMTIPYLAPTTHYEMHAGHCPIYERGRLNLNVQSPLKTGATGSQQVEVSVWISFTDVELRGPIVPQSSGPMSRAPRKKFKKSYMQEEVDAMMESKIVSKGLLSGSKVAGALSAIPLLSDIAAPASWVLGVLGGVASSLGFSRPLVDTVPEPRTIVYDKYMASGDGVSAAVPLAMTSHNALSVEQYSYTDEDEMSFAFLNSVEAQIDSYTITTGDGSGALVYSKKIGPKDLAVSQSVTIGTNTQSILTGPPICYLANKFLAWRGSIAIRMVPIMTNMQTCRVLITFTPLSATTTTSPTLATSSYSLREIHDLVPGEEIDIECGYFMPVPHLLTTQASGTLEVRILNSLVTPDTAAQSIDLLVYAKGGPSFQLAIPANVGSVNVQPLVPQMGDEDMGVVIPDEVDFAARCVGEKIMSTRQMLRYVNLPTTEYITTSATNRAGNFYPWVFGHVEMTSDSLSPLTTPNYCLDAMSFVAGMYALYRGGLEVTYLNDTSTQTPASLFFGTVDGSAPFAATNIVDLGGADAVAGHSYSPVMSGTGVNYAVSTTINQLVQAQVPYYNRFPVSLLKPGVVVSDDKSRPMTSLLLRAVGTPKQSFARRAAEDFTFSLFVGCPPWVVPSVPA